MRIRLILFLMIFFLVLPFVYSSDKIDKQKDDVTYSMELIKGEINGIKYTPECLVDCHMPFNITIDTSNSSKKDRDKPEKIKIKDILGLRLEDKKDDDLVSNISNIKILENVTFKRDVFDHNEYKESKKVKNINLDNWNSTHLVLFNSSIKGNFTNKFIFINKDILWDYSLDSSKGWLSYNLSVPVYKKVDDWSYEWQDITGKEKVYGNSFIIDYVGKRKAGLGFKSTDLVPKLDNIEFPEFAWFNSSWANRVNLTIKNSKVYEDVNDFPMLINLSDLGTDFFNKVNLDGSDIRITTSEGIQLPREIVSIDTTLKNGEMWVKSNLSSSIDTILMIYFNNPLATEPSPTSTYGSENVWNSNYLNVQHMNEDPSTTCASTNEFCDSTSNSHDGNAIGSMTSADRIIGNIYNATDFDGSNDKSNVADVSTLTPPNSFTLSMWVNVASYDGDLTTWYGKWSESGSNREYNLGESSSSSNKIIFYVSSTGSNAFQVEGVRPSTGTWTLIHASMTASSSINLYSDAVSIGNTTSSIPSAVHNGNADYTIGGPDDTFGGASRFPAIKIDEVRLIKGALSTGWMSTEYENQKNASTFYTIGSVEGAPYFNTTIFNTTSISSGDSVRLFTEVKDLANDQDTVIATFMYPNGTLINKTMTKFIDSPIETTNDIGDFPSMAIDSNGFLHVAYRDVTTTGLRYCNNTLGSWSCESVTSDDPYEISLSIDNNNNPRIIIGVSLNDETLDCSKSGGTWTCNNIYNTATKTASGDARGISSIFDSNNILHVVQRDLGNDVNYCNSSSFNTCNTNSVEIRAGNHRSPTVLINSTGALHTFYDDNAGNKLLHSYSIDNGSTWTNETVFSQFASGVDELDAVIDSSDIFHIIDSEFDSGFTQLTPVYCTGTTGNWTCNNFVDDMGITTENTNGDFQVILDNREDLYFIHRLSTNTRLCEKVNNTFFNCEPFVTVDSSTMGHRSAASYQAPLYLQSQDSTKYGDMYFAYKSNGDLKYWRFSNFTIDNNLQEDVLWYFDWTDTTATGTYNVTSIWANDTAGNTNSTTYSDLSFEVTSPLETLTIDGSSFNPASPIDPIESNNRTITYLVNLTNSTTMDKCLYRVFNSSDSYGSPTFSERTGTLQKTGSQEQCTMSFDLEFWRNQGTWNIDVFLNLTEGTINWSNNTFTYNELIAYNITQTPTWSTLSSNTNNNVADQHLIVKNTGNHEFTQFNITGYNLLQGSNTLLVSGFNVDDDSGFTSPQTLSNATQITVDSINLTTGENVIDTIYHRVNLSTLPSGTYTTTPTWQTSAN